MKHLQRIACDVDVSSIRAILERYPILWGLWTGQPPPDSVRPFAQNVMGKPCCYLGAGKRMEFWEALYLRWKTIDDVPLDPKIDAATQRDDDFNCTTFVPEIEATAHWARDTLRTVAALIGAREMGQIYLSMLRAGDRIPLHVDKVGRYFEHISRFHCAVTSNPDCSFTVGDETVHMAPGELWWFDHRVAHSVTNEGADRIHLVFDAVVPTSVGRLARQAEAAA